ncbi:MAG: hypothetical protein ABIL62_20200 [Planctomycetota bacterium]
MGVPSKAKVGKKRFDFSAKGYYFMTIKISFRFEYRIIAVNKAGEGEPSNTEMVVYEIRLRGE